VVIWMLSLALVIRYPLTRQRLSAIRSMLEERRGKL
jgi:Na+/melibiose symporter-like transporter